jgi:hypothetical protein
MTLDDLFNFFVGVNMAHKHTVVVEKMSTLLLILGAWICILHSEVLQSICMVNQHG